MTSRRNGGHKPEVLRASEQIWTSVVQALGTLDEAHQAGNDRVSQVNDILRTLPPKTDRDFNMHPSEQYKGTYRKLHATLNEVKAKGEDELKAISDALESISVLMALKKSPENNALQEKRAKRARLSSPASCSRTPGGTPPPHTLTLSLPARPLQPHTSFSREPKARREALAGQLPLQPGRRVAFRPAPNKGGVVGVSDGKKGESEGGDEWILAVVKKCINQDKNRYEVQDADLTEDGKPGPCYNTTLRALIPLPDPTAPVGSITHPSSYEEFPVGSIVMAQYPDTTTFYRAEVIVGPKESIRGANSKSTPVYRLKFEDDDGQVRPVAAHLVVEWPGDY